MNQTHFHLNLIEKKPLMYYFSKNVFTCFIKFRCNPRFTVRLCFCARVIVEKFVFEQHFFCLNVCLRYCSLLSIHVREFQFTRSPIVLYFSQYDFYAKMSFTLYWYMRKSIMNVKKLHATALQFSIFQFYGNIVY